MNYAPELPNAIHVRLSDVLSVRLKHEARRRRQTLSATTRQILEAHLLKNPLPQKRPTERPRSKQDIK